MATITTSTTMPLHAGVAPTPLSPTQWLTKQPETAAHQAAHHSSLLHSFEEYVHHFARSHPAIHAFFPRFDVEEHADAYELFGELPGCRMEDIHINELGAGGDAIEITGVTYRYSYPTHPVTGEKVEVKHVPIVNQEKAEQEKQRWHGLAEPGMEAQVESAAATSERKDTQTSDDFQITSAPPADKPAEESSAPAEGAEADKAKTAAQTKNAVKGGPGVMKELPKPTERTLFHERQVGNFQRSFRFPGPIDTTKVVAELKDGILRVRVSKDPVKIEELEREKKRIEIAWANASLWGI